MRPTDVPGDESAKFIPEDPDVKTIELAAPNNSA